jgi:hypothetical protein
VSFRPTGMPRGMPNAWLPSFYAPDDWSVLILLLPPYHPPYRLFLPPSLLLFSLSLTCFLFLPQPLLTLHLSPSPSLHLSPSLSTSLSESSLNLSPFDQHLRLFHHSHQTSGDCEAATLAQAVQTRIRQQHVRPLAAGRHPRAHSDRFLFSPSVRARPKNVQIGRCLHEKHYTVTFKAEFIYHEHGCGKRLLCLRPPAPLSRYLSPFILLSLSRWHALTARTLPNGTTRGPPF